MSGFHNIEALLSEQAWMKRVARSLVGASAANDLVQETYQAALKSPPEADRPIRPWLAKVLRNRAHTRWRGDQRRDQREQAIQPVAPETPLDHATILQTQTLLCEALRDLAEPFRATLFAHYYEDKSLAEIAREQGVPEGTVRWRHREGLARIRAELDRSPGGRSAWLAALAPLCPPGPPLAPLSASFAAGIGKVLLVKKLLAVAAALVVAMVILVVALRVRTGPTEMTPTKPVTTKRYSTGAPLDDTPRLSPAAADIVGVLRLEGQVIDGNSAPLGNVTVTLDVQPPRTATTEADGSFAFDGLGEGNYALVASVGPLATAVSTDWLTATSDPVQIRLIAGGAVELSAVDELGQPVAGARVALHKAYEPAARSDEPTMLTNDRGIAKLAPVSPGPLSFTVTADGFASINVDTSAGGPGTVARIVAQMVKGTQLTGRVVDPTGAPIRGASVEASRANDTRGAWLTHATSGDNGAFTFPALGPGEYLVIASDHNFQPATSRVVIAATGSQDPIVLTLVRGAELRGRVTDGSGSPAKAAEVLLTRADDPVRSFEVAGADHPKIVTADANGQFRAAGLFPGRYTVVAQRGPSGSKVSLVDLSAEPLSLDLVLSETATIAGIAVNDAGEPVPEVAIQLNSAFGENNLVRLAMTDSRGGFRFGALSSGAYQVAAVQNHSLDYRGAAHVLAGDQHARVVLSAPTRITGRLVLESGAAPRYAMIIAPPVRVPVAADGRFEIESLHRTPTFMFVIGEDFAEQPLPEINASPGKTIDLGDIVVNAGRSVEGIVLDERGKPIANATVSMRRDLDRSDPAQRQTLTATNGQFKLEHVPPGNIQLYATHPTAGRSRPTVVVAPFTQIDLHRGGTVRGVVTRGGQPVSGAYVVASWAHQATADTFTNPDGSYVFSEITPDTVTIKAAASRSDLDQGITRSVNVTNGADVTMNLELQARGYVVEVNARPASGAKVDAAIMMLVNGTVGPRDVRSMTHARRPALWLANGGPATFRDVEPGVYTLCAQPFTGPVLDPAFRAWAEEHTEQIEIVCTPVTVTNGPTSTAIELPGMKPPYPG
ncbi:MAG: sigma-70 family RNA polymerase sigma factor [Kofleriaceae bacterium]